jgi:hypothetical protein
MSKKNTPLPIITFFQKLNHLIVNVSDLDFPDGLLENK